MTHTTATIDHAAPYRTPTNGPLIAVFEAAAATHIAALSAFHKLGGRDIFDVSTATYDAMMAAREAVMASTTYRPPAIVYPVAKLTPRERITALGMQYGLKGNALKVFVTETSDAQDRLQSFDAAEWRIGSSRLRALDEELALNALRKWKSTI